MPYIEINNEHPGIRGLMAAYPDTAAPLNALANAMLRDTVGLTPLERELIATYVSHLNDCMYCQNAHGAIACHHNNGQSALIFQVKKDYPNAAISDKLKSLLAIAGKVQQSGKKVMPEDIDNARAQGATDKDIHDTVLIAAAFCMYNRYVDGLATFAPADFEGYLERAKTVYENGYGSHIHETEEQTENAI